MSRPKKSFIYLQSPSPEDSSRNISITSVGSSSVPNNDSTTVLLSPSPELLETTHAPPITYSRIGKIRRSRVGVLCVVSLALFTDLIIYGVIVPILPKILEEVGHPNSKGLLFAIYAVGLLVFTPIFGILSDRYMNRQIPMLFGLLGLAVATLFFAFSTSFEALIFARILQGISAAASWVVGLAMLADTYPPERLGFAMGIVMSLNTMGFFTGPLIGGIFTEYFNMKTPFYICAGFALLDFLGRLFIIPPKPGTPHQPITLLSSTNNKEISVVTPPPSMNISSFLRLLKKNEVIVLGITIILGSSSFSAMETLIAEHLKEEFHLSLIPLSLVVMSFMIPNVVMSLIVGYISDKVIRYKIIFAGMIFHSAAPVLVGLSPTIPLIIATSVYFGVTASIMMTPISSEMGTIANRDDSASYAQIYAIYNAFYSIGMIIGPIASEQIQLASNSLAWGMSLLTFSLVAYAPIYLVLSVLFFKRRTNLNYKLSNVFGIGIKSTVSTHSLS